MTVIMSSNPANNGEPAVAPYRDSTVILTKFFAGGLAASTALTATAPLERSKLILQIQDRSTNIPPHLRYKGLIDCFRRIPKEQGFLSFWRGNTASVIRTFPYHALNFSLKDVIRDFFISKYHQRSVLGQTLVNVLTGAVAGGISLFAIYPLDYARTRMAMDVGNCKLTREYSTLRECLKDAYTASGIRGIYRGLSVSIVGVMMYRSAYFGIYDSGIDFIPTNSRSFGTQFLLAEIAATSAGLLSFPLDTVRRSMMMQSGKTPRSELYNSSLQCMQSIYQNEGMRGFYKGCAANIVRGTGGAMMLMLYDNLNYFLLGQKGHHFHQKPVDLEVKEKQSIQTMKSDTTVQDSVTPATDETTTEVRRESFCNF